MRIILVVLALLTLVLGTFCGYLAVAESRERAVRIGVEQQIDRLAESVDKLTNTMERVLRERNVADVNLVVGDTSTVDPQTVTWKSGTQSISLTVYRSSSSVVGAAFTAEVQANVAKYQGSGYYPTN